MSESKRVALTSIGPKKSKSTPKDTKCIRLNLTLSEPNKEWCPVFDYEALAKVEQDKIDSEKKKKEVPLNGSNSFDDDKDVKKMAKHFEEKYGTSDRKYTYAQLGEGYDENDSFIDNTEICEEQLVEGYTKFDGYYVNNDKFNSNGSSERRSSDDTNGRQKKRRKNRIVSETESDSESESSGSKKAKIDKKPFEDSVMNGVKVPALDLSQSSSMQASSGTLGGDSKSEESQTFKNQLKQENHDRKINSPS